MLREYTLRIGLVAVLAATGCGGGGGSAPVAPPATDRIAVTTLPAAGTGGYDAQSLYLASADDTAAVQPILHGVACQPVWSPDGSRVAYDYVNSGSGQLSLLITNADGSRQQGRGPIIPYSPLLGAPAVRILWSPDGRQMLVHIGGQFTIVDADTGASQALAAPPAPVQDIISAAWSPDGQRIAVLSQAGALGVLRVSDGTLLSALVTVPNKYDYRSLGWLPGANGGQIVIVGNGAARNSGVYRMNGDGSGSPTPIDPSVHDVVGWAASPDGKRLALVRGVANQLAPSPGVSPYLTASFDVDVVPTDGAAPARKITSVQAAAGPPDRIPVPSWSPDDLRFALPVPTGGVEIVDAATGAVHYLANAPQERTVYVAWQP